MRLTKTLPGLLLILCGTVAPPHAARAQAAAGDGRDSSTQTPPPPLTRAAEDADAPAGWKRYEYQYGGGDLLSVVFPRPPEEIVQKAAVGPEAFVVTHIMTAESPAGVYIAGYIELPAGNARITPALKEAIFNKFWTFFAAGLQKGLGSLGLEAKLTALEPRKTVIGGREGQEQEFMVGKIPGRYRALVGERHIYMVIAMTFKNNSPDERTSFFESFKIVPQR